MKKKVIILLSAMFLLVSSSVYAANSSLINSKVNKIVSLVVNGSKINTDAIVINGVTYVPIRAVGKELNMNADYKNDTVYLTSNESDSSNKTEDNTPVIDNNLGLKNQLKLINTEIEAIQSEIKMLNEKNEENLASFNKNVETQGADVMGKWEDSIWYKTYQERKAPLDQKLNELLKKKTEIENQLSK